MQKKKKTESVNATSQGNLTKKLDEEAKSLGQDYPCSPCANKEKEILKLESEKTLLKEKEELREALIRSLYEQIDIVKQQCVMKQDIINDLKDRYKVLEAQKARDLKG